MIIQDGRNGATKVDVRDLSTQDLFALINDPEVQAEYQRRLHGVMAAGHPFHMPGKHNQKDHGRKGVKGLYSKAQSGGFTYKVSDSSQPKTGFALSPYPERSKVIPSASFGSGDIKDYAKANRDLLAKPDHYMGAWREKDGKTDQMWLDVSVVKKTRAEGEKAGKQYDQKAMFDLGKGEEINLGGTGGQ
jgi:hypothetical protein